MANFNGMNWMTCFLTVFVLSTSTSIVNGALSDYIVLEVSESVVKVNTTVVFTCRVKTTDDSLVINFNKAARSELNYGKDITTEQITIGTTVVGPYKGGRFAVERTTDAEDRIYRLTINGVQNEDSGTYLCGTADLSDFSLQRLEVYRLPDSLEFANREPSEVVSLLEAEAPENLTCVASHFMPHADLTVTVGDRDVTDQFLLTATTNVLCSNVGQLNKPCPLYVDYSSAAEPRGFRPLARDNGLELTCTFRARDFERDTINTSVTLNVKHRPYIVCGSPIFVRVNQTTVKANCSVVSNPPSSILNRTWIINYGKSNEVRINAPYLADEYKAEEITELTKPTSVNATLVINRFIRAFLQNTYHYEVVNEIGTFTAQLTFREVLEAANGGDGQQSSFSVLLWTGILALVSSSLLHHYP